jgi:hypothetical protein
MAFWSTRRNSADSRALQAEIARVVERIAILEDRQKGLSTRTPVLNPSDRSLRALRAAVVSEELSHQRERLALLRARVASRPVGTQPSGPRPTIVAGLVGRALAILVRVAAASIAVVVANNVLSTPGALVTKRSLPSPSYLIDVPAKEPLAPDRKEARMADLGAWPSRAGWSTMGGLLINDGSDFGDANWLGELWNLHWISAPAPPPGSDYAVEAEIQVLHRPPCGSFGLVARGGYQAGVHFCSEHGGPIVAIRSRRPELLMAVPFEPQPGWHAYRLEARDTTLRVLVDGVLVAEVEDDGFTEPGQAGLWDDHTELALRRFDVFELDEPPQIK